MAAGLQNRYSKITRRCLGGHPPSHRPSNPFPPALYTAMFRAIFKMLGGFTLRCPNCRGESMLRNYYVFKPNCSKCTFKYLVDEGDFWGGVVYSYTFAGVSGLFVAYLLDTFSPLGWRTILYASAGAAIASILLFFPFAKSLWVYTLFLTRGQYEEYRVKKPPGDPE